MTRRQSFTRGSSGPAVEPQRIITHHVCQLIIIIFPSYLPHPEVRRASW